MGMIFQTSDLLKEPINIAGCLFRSLLGIAEWDSRFFLSADQINNAYDEAVDRGLMSEECWVYYHQDIINIGLRMLGNTHTAVYLWKTVFSSRAGSPWDSGLELEPNYYIRHGHTGRNGHFVNSNKLMHTTWDPYFPFTTLEEDLSFRAYYVG